MADPRLIITPNVTSPVPLDLMGVPTTGADDGVFLGEGPDALQLPVPDYDEEFAESADSEGGSRLRSRPSNPIGTVQGYVYGPTTTATWENLNTLQKTIEMCRRNRGFITYQPLDGTEVTYVLESIRLTEAPQRHLLQANKLAPFTFEFTCKPYGLLASQEQTVGMFDTFSYDSIGNGEWSFDTGAAGLSVTAGALVPSSTAEKRLYRSLLTAGDQSGQIQINTGASVASGSTAIVLKRLGTTSEIRAKMNFIGGNQATLEVTKYTSGPTETSLATSASFVVAPNKSYWLLSLIGLFGSAGQAPGLTITLVYETDPTGPDRSNPLMTLVYGLSGSDLTTWGQDANGNIIFGNTGLRLVPQGTDWTWTNWAATARSVIDNNPVAQLGFLDIPGSVPGLLELNVDDPFGLPRRHVEVGINDDFVTGNPAYIMAALLQPVGIGVAGTGPTGVVSTNTITQASPYLLTSTPNSICSTGPQAHEGPRKVKARVYGTGSGTIYLRLAYRIGSGSWIRRPWAALPSTGKWYEIELDVVDLPAHVVGNQTWEGRIEAYSVTTGDKLDVNYIEVLPAKRFGRAKASYDIGRESVLVSEGFDQAGSPTLEGQSVNGAGVQTVTRFAGTGADDGTGVPGTVSWSNINIGSSDNNKATAFYPNTALPAGITYTHLLKATNFGFSGLIPAGATILGVRFDVEKQSNLYNGIGLNLVTSGDNTFRLLKAGVATGNEKKQGWWPYNADGVVSYGGPNDKFGTTLALSDITASTFGCMIQAYFNVNYYLGITIDRWPQFWVDAIKCTVWYTESGGVTWQELGAAQNSFTVDSGVHRAKRTVGSDSSPLTNGPSIAYVNTTGNYDNTGVAVTVYKDDQANESGLWRGGPVAHYRSSGGVHDHYIAALFDIDLAATPAYAQRIAVWQLAGSGGNATLLQSVPFSGSLATGRRLWLEVDANNNYWVWVGNPPQLVMVGNNATAGAVTSGKAGFFDVKSGSATPNRYYDDFEVWTPEYPAPVIPASGRLTITDSAVYGPDGSRPEYFGSYLKVNPSGAEKRKVRMVVKARLNDVDQLPDDYPFGALANWGVRVSARLTPRVTLLG